MKIKDRVSVDYGRLAMPLGEAMFTQRSIRRFRPDPIPIGDLRLILEAAFRAPNGGNQQIARFLMVTDREKIRAFGKLYHEAWWAKRREDQGWTKPESTYRSRTRATRPRCAWPTKSAMCRASSSPSPSPRARPTP